MDTIDYHWLEQHIFHRQLGEDEKTVLTHLIRIEHFSSGQSLNIKTHGANGSIYLIRSGSVTLHFELENNIAYSADMAEGAQIGDMAFLEQSAQIAMDMIEDVVTYKISRAALANLLIFNKSANLKELWPTQKLVVNGAPY